MTSIFTYISMLSVLPPAFMALSKFKFFSKKQTKILAIFSIYSFISEVVSFITCKFGFTSAVLPGVHSTLEVLIIFLYYTSDGKYLKQRILLALVWVVCAIYMFYNLHQANYLLYPSSAKIIHSIAIIITSTYYGYKWIQANNHRVSDLMIVVSFLAYHTMTIASFLYMNKLPLHWHHLLWIVNDFFNIIVNVACFWVIYLNVKSSANRTSSDI